MRPRHRMAVGPWRRRSDRELVGTLLALIETGQVVAHPAITGAGRDQWALRRPGDTSLVRELPGDNEARGDSDFVPGAGVRGGRPSRMCDQLADIGWVNVGEPNEVGIRAATLSEEGGNWLAFCRGNTWDIDLARIPDAHAEIEMQRAAFRVYCEDQGIDHGHQDVEQERS